MSSIKLNLVSLNKVAIRSQNTHWIFVLLAVLSVAFLSNIYASDARAQSVIESQVDGDFGGWEGETVIRLTNGQIWIQKDYHYEYHYAFMPEVLIYQSSSSGWKMLVAGTSKAISVERIR